MKIHSYQKTILEEVLNTKVSEEQLNEANIIDIVKTVTTSKKIKSDGKKLEKLYIDKAKEKIKASNAENDKEKERAEKSLDVIREKITVIIGQIDDRVKNCNFMTKWIETVGSIAKNGARMKGLEKMSSFYDDPEIDDQIKKLKEKMREDIKSADEEKGKLKEDDKKKIEQAKHDVNGDKEEKPKEKNYLDDKTTDEKIAHYKENIEYNRTVISKASKKIKQYSADYKSSHLSKEEYEDRANKLNQEIKIARKEIETWKKEIEKLSK